MTSQDGDVATSVPLSVLDLCPVPTGVPTSEALRRSVDLARHVETWGYWRYWVAEHHNLAGIASSAPAVLVGQVAAATSSIRVGSGGVMLPNHVPLVVAEQFGMLEAMYPGRVDLGIGRAPGTDQVTARALRRNMEALSAEDFPQQLVELQAYFLDQPAVGPLPRVRAIPAEGNQPAIWLLGSSGYSAQLAGLLGAAVRVRSPFQRGEHAARTGFVPPDFQALRRADGTVLSDQRGGTVRGRCRAGLLVAWLISPVDAASADRAPLNPAQPRGSR